MIERETLRTAIKDLLAICDGSNWPEDAQEGPKYQAYSEITEQLHDVVANMQAALEASAP